MTTCRVLVVASKYLPEYTGAAFRIHRTYERLGAELQRIGVICGSEQFPDCAQYMLDGTQVTRVTAGRWHDWTRRRQGFRRGAYFLRCWIEAIRVWKRLENNARPDVVHVFGSSAVTATAIWWAWYRKLPLVIELVTKGARPHQYLPGQRYIWPFRLRSGIAVIAISDALHKASGLEGLGAVTWSRPNPVDIGRFRPASLVDRDALRAELTGFSPGDKVLCMVGKFMPQKNQIFLVDVLARLPADWKLVLVGPHVADGRLGERDSDYLDRLKRRIVELGLGERVCLKAEFVEAEKWMRLSDVYAMPNTDEGLGTPMLEAMCCGLPVVANATEEAFRQWVEDDWNGFSVPLTVAKWAAVIEAAACFPEGRRLGIAEWAAARFSQAEIDRRFAGIMQTVAGWPVTDPAFTAFGAEGRP